MRISVNARSAPIDLEYDAEQTLWRSSASDRGTALLHMLSADFKSALRGAHRHVILRNALRRPQNLAQILLFVGFGGGFSEILPVDDILTEVIKEGAAGDGDLQIVCHWTIGRDGKPVFPQHPGRMMEVKRTIRLEDLQEQSLSFIACVDDCAAESDRMGGTWLRRREDDPASRRILPDRIARF
jgi:hypothetical protein